MTDQELIRQLRSKDAREAKAARRLFCLSYAKSVEVYIAQKISQKEIQEELLQDVLLDGLIVLGRKDFMLEKRIYTYLIGIAKNKCHNFLRKQKQEGQRLKQVSFEEGKWGNVFEQQFDTPANISASKKLEALKTAFEVITKKEAGKSKDKNCGYLLHTKYIENYSHQEIASMLNKKEDAVKMKIKRCREKFFALIEKALKGSEL